MKIVDIVAIVLLIIGGLNWALVGIFEFNLVAALFGELSVLSRIVYILVGLAALYEAFGLPAQKRRWHCTATMHETPAY